MRKYSRRDFIKAAGLSTATLMTNPLPSLLSGERQEKRPNILLITSDDMHWDSPGCFGGQTPAITPNIDRLASQGMRFMHAHMTTAVCQPSRSSLMTGRYPHRHGAEGFEPIDRSVPTLQEQLHEAGYLNATLGKVKHLEPKDKFKWDLFKYKEELGYGRDAKLFYTVAKNFMQTAVSKGQPFSLLANVKDPHRFKGPHCPFYGSKNVQKKFKDLPSPSRVYKPTEVTVPGFMPDLPEIRKEMAQYYSSVRRCDDIVGVIMRALDESGQAQNTIVIFLSDHGMSMPFAKTNCYRYSTRTPWIVVWPGKVKPGTVDKQHFISGIDFMPTLLDAIGLPQPKGMDGFSFLPILLGQQQAGRNKVFTQFYENFSKRRYPMRAVHNHRYGYIFNPWSNGKRQFNDESDNSLTFNAMKEAAKTNKKIADRINFFRYRVLEEFYDYSKDPYSLDNLIAEPAYIKEIDKMRKELLEWMERTKDPELKAFRPIIEDCDDNTISQACQEIESP